MAKGADRELSRRIFELKAADRKHRGDQSAPEVKAARAALKKEADRFLKERKKDR